MTEERESRREWVGWTGLPYPGDGTGNTGGVVYKEGVGGYGMESRRAATEVLEPSNIMEFLGLPKGLSKLLPILLEVGVVVGGDEISETWG
jgi:hypothetical protein